MENCEDYVNELYAKFEDRAPDKWNDILKNINDEGLQELVILQSKDEARVLSQEAILFD